MARRKYSHPTEGLQMSMFTPEGDWRPPSELPNLKAAKKIGIDCETRDERLKTLGPGGVRNDGYMAGFSVATEDGYKWYFPMRHLGGGNLSPDTCIRWAQEELTRPNQEKVGVNLLYDLEWFKASGVDVAGPFYDCSVAEALIDEEAMSYSLDAMLKKYFGDSKTEELLEEAGLAYGFFKEGGSKSELKKNMWKLPSKYVGPYAEDDALGPLKIQQAQLKILHNEDLMQVLKQEMELLPILLAMRFKGVKVDLEKAANLSKNWEAKEKDLRYKLKNKTGFLFDEGFEWSSKCLGELCDSLNISYSRSGKNGLPLIDKYFLEGQTNPIMHDVRRLRGLNRLKGTYVNDLIFKYEVNGRIHCQFKPTRSEDGGTRSGRFASSNPNLQQVPARDEELAPHIRGLFIPDDGFLWGKLDYSQQEPRIAVHYAHALKLDGAHKAITAYREDRKADFYMLLSKLSGFARKPCKTIYLGRSYGMGKAKMAHDMGVSEIEAQSIFDKFDAELPFIKALADRCRDKADERGFIKTFLGRRSRFNEWEPVRSFNMRQEGIDCRAVSSRAEGELKWPGEKLKRAYTYKAMNRLCQGSSADMTKKAMIDLHNETGIIPYLTVHDEVDVPLIDEEQGQFCQNIMEQALPLSCPINCDLDIIETWK